MITRRARSNINIYNERKMYRKENETSRQSFIFEYNSKKFDLNTDVTVKLTNEEDRTLVTQQ